MQQQQQQNGDYWFWRFWFMHACICMLERISKKSTITSYVRIALSGISCPYIRSSQRIPAAWNEKASQSHFAVLILPRFEIVHIERTHLPNRSRDLLSTNCESRGEHCGKSISVRACVTDMDMMATIKMSIL